ncbi:MAG: PadR family transcriptional regulator [Acidimicrobiales bacterium]
MLELAILGLLKERPMHGYDIRKSLREDFGVLSNLSFGSLYPALARLEAAHAVRAAEPLPPLRRGRRAEDDMPLTGSLTGERAALVARRATAKAAIALGGRSTRARKVYEITPHGEEIFEQLLEAADEQGGDPRGFSLRLAFARHLTPPARVRLLEKRRGELIERLQHGERSLGRRSRPMDEYERSIAEHAQETVANDLSWVERLLDRERTSLDRSSRVPAAPGRAPLGGAPTKDLGDAPLPARAGTGVAWDGRQRP